jgi:iron complex transport system ATP-binding protein
VSELLLHAHGLVHEYPGGVQALRGLELAVQGGELLAVIGPNGSGKSTLLRCLSALIVPSAGSVLLDGRPIGRHAPRERARRVAVVPQFLPALPELSVEAFVLGGRYAWLRPWRGPARADLEIVRAALVDCDAFDLATRLVAELSGGQRQRVLVARALAQEARILLVDEPTNSLDPEHQVRVFDLLARLTTSGRAALVVTHDLNLASQFADRVVLMHEGRIVAQGAVDAVLRRDVLEPVYGPHLHYGRLPVAGGRERPFVLPWMPRT